MNPSDTDKAPEAERRTSLAELRSILKNTPDYVLLLAPDLTIRFINRTYPNVTIDKVVGTSILDWVQPDHRADYQAMLRRALETGMPQQLEAAGTEEGNVQTWYLSRVVPVHENGHVQRLVVVGQDSTVRRQAEEALRRERDMVSRLMETSPVGLVSLNREGEIVYANGRADTLLGLVGGGTTAVGRTYNAPTWHISDPAGGNFPDDGLPFSRVKATGRPVYGIRHAINNPDGRRVQLSINAAPMIAPDGDFAGMVASIEDVTDRTRAEEELRRTQARVRQGTDVLMEGCQILGFDWRFLYLNDAAARQGRKPKDEFLGRTIMEVLPGIVRRHGGHMAVESEPGQGATFRIFLPAATSVAPALATAVPTRSTPLAGRRVLVMDDEPAVRDVMAAVLLRCGAEVTTTPGGDAAVAAFVAARDENRAYDVVILDLTIPGEPGGREVLARLRAIDPDVRGVATSGYSDDPVMARPEAFGFAVSLRKPHTRKELQAALELALAP